MKKILNKIATITAAAVLWLCSGAFPCAAAEESDLIYILIEAETGTVLEENRSEEQVNAG